LKAIAEELDLVLVVSLANSSNSVRLVELAHRHDTPSHLIDALAERGPVTVVERETTREIVHFTLPSAVRRS